MEEQPHMDQNVKQCFTVESHGGCHWGPMKMKKGLEVETEAGVHLSFLLISVLLKILLEERELRFKSLKIIALVTGPHLLDFLQQCPCPAIGKIPTGCPLLLYTWDLICTIQADRWTRPW